MSAIPPAAPGSVAAFWARAGRALGLPGGPPPPAEAFGDGPALADELLALVLAGPKRATAGARAHYEAAGDPLPVPGGRWIVTDGAGVPRALLRTTEVRVGPLSSVDDAFAYDEGEGDRTRAWWLAAHEAYFRRTLPAVGVAFTPEVEVVFERFALEYAEPADGAPAAQVAEAGAAPVHSPGSDVEEQ